MKVLHIILENNHIEYSQQLSALMAKQKIDAVIVTDEDEKNIIKNITKQQIDVIHCHSEKSLQLAHKARKKTNASLVATIGDKDSVIAGKNSFYSFCEYLVPAFYLTEKEEYQIKIYQIYLQSIFKKHVPRPFPILMYHKVLEKNSPTKHKIFVSIKEFEKHLKFFKWRNLTPLTFSELTEYWTLKKSYIEFPKKPIMLTFDDGYQNNLIHAQPLLKKYNMKATLFLLADTNIKFNEWDKEEGITPDPLLTIEERQNHLDQNIFDIGSHGMTHIHYQTTKTEKVELHMRQSKKLLEMEFKRPISAIAYPYGDSNADVEKTAEKCGYTFAVNIDKGGEILSDNPFAIFRINVFPKESLFSLWKKTSWWYRYYFKRKRKR